MCGIAGIIGDISDEKVDIIKNMISSLYHRGPDAQRILKTDNSLLAFSRLKIIDFNDRSMQPMVSSDKKNILLFNGEIYNYKELKDRLREKYLFKTKSDTEVLLAMLKIYGYKCIEEVNGMFAFCYFDVEKNTYILARDRFGQKPLYYSKKNGSIYFSSEIKALLVAGIIREPNLESISEYLNYGGLDSKETTWFKNITQIKAGEILFIDRFKKIKKHKWYSLEKKDFSKVAENIPDKKKFISETLMKVCEEHLNSDTRIGVKLSGGLDSSTMLASMEKNKKYLSNQCFSVDFGSSFSEKEWIMDTAKYFNKKMNIVSYRENDFLKDFEKLIYTHEGPLGGLMNCAFEKVYQSAKEKGIRVLLDGTGLDEAFGGYRIHHFLFLRNLYSKKNGEFNKSLEDYSNQWNVNIKSVLHDIQNFSLENNYTQDSSYFSQNSFTTKYIQSLSKKKINKDLYNNDNFHKNLIDYIDHSKIPKNTRIKDRQSMSYSIELRMPFLDHRIIELGLSLNEKNYFKKGLTKSIIREAMFNKLPNAVRLGQKRSIQAPQDLFLKSPKIAEFTLELINSVKFKNRGIFNVKNINETYKNFLTEGSKNTFHIWQWINVEKFFNIFIDQEIKENIKIKEIEIEVLK